MSNVVASVRGVPQWSLIRTLGPQTRPISLEQAKAHLRINQTDSTHDATILDDIDNAVEAVEKRTERVLITAEFEAVGTHFPTDGPIPLSRDPVQSVKKIEYLDHEHQRIELDSADYEFSPERRGVFPAPGVSWPGVTQHHDAVRVGFVAGYGDTGASTPRSLLEACYLLITEAFYGIDQSEPFERKIKKFLRTGYP